MVKISVNAESVAAGAKKPEAYTTPLKPPKDDKGALNEAIGSVEP